jgi:hypothetical protein
MTLFFGSNVAPTECRLTATHRRVQRTFGAKIAVSVHADTGIPIIRKEQKTAAFHEFSGQFAN